MEQFHKYSTDPAKVPVEPYDFWSIMHYDSYAFSSNGQATITDLDGNVFRTKVSMNSLFLVNQGFLKWFRQWVSK